MTRTTELLFEMSIIGFAFLMRDPHKNNSEIETTLNCLHFCLNLDEYHYSKTEKGEYALTYIYRPLSLQGWKTVSLSIGSFANVSPQKVT